MGEPNAQKWAERIRTDLEWRKSNIDPRMSKCLLLLNPTINIRDEQLRSMAPLARRIARGLTTMDFLQRLPSLDAEFKGEGEDHSNFIEDIVMLLGDRAQARDRMKQMQATLLWSPVAWVKLGMPLLGVERDNGMSEATPEMIEGTEDFREVYEPVPEETVAALNLRNERIPELDGSFESDINKDPLPRPTSSLDIPWCDWVDPHHIVCDRGVNEVSDAYYIAHLFVRTVSQFKNGDYINKDKVMTYATGVMDGKEKKGGARQHLGGPLMKTFSIPSAEEVVVLAEVYIREDPEDSTTKQLVGVLDIMSGTWVKPLRHNPLGVNNFVTVKASDESPGIYSGPSYIEQAWDDITELAWARNEFRKHVRNYRSYKDIVPEEIEFDSEEWKKYKDPSYTGPVRITAGNPERIARGPRPPQMPPALIQWRSMMETDFARNTGVTATQQGEGASNKVATAFRQEAQFSNERRSEIRYRLYQAYAQMMTIMTYLIQRYTVSPVEVRRGPIKFQFSGDTLKGIMGYTVDVIDLERSDPLSDRLMEIQTIERLLGHPILAQQFDAHELAKRIAQLNRWGNRVLVSAQPGGQGQPAGAPGAEAGPESGGSSGTSGILGNGVDSGQLNGQTGSAVEGAALRRG